MITLLPGAAGDHRPLDLLAEAAGVRLRRADPDRVLGQGRPPDRRPPARGLGGHHRRCWLIACLGLFTLDAAGLSTEDSYTKEFDSIVGQKVLAEHGLVDESNTVQVVANADEADAVREAMTGIEGVGEPSEPVVQDGVAFIQAPIAGRRGLASEAFDTVETVRDAVHAGRRAPTRSSAAGRRSTSTPRSPPTATTS